MTRAGRIASFVSTRCEVSSARLRLWLQSAVAWQQSATNTHIVQYIYNEISKPKVWRVVALWAERHPEDRKDVPYIYIVYEHSHTNDKKTIRFPCGHSGEVRANRNICLHSRDGNQSAMHFSLRRKKKQEGKVLLAIAMHATNTTCILKEAGAASARWPFCCIRKQKESALTGQFSTECYARMPRARITHV